MLLCAATTFVTSCGGGGGTTAPTPVMVQAVSAPRASQGATGQALLAYHVSFTDKAAFPLELSFNTQNVGGLAVAGSACGSGIDYAVQTGGDVREVNVANKSLSGKITFSGSNNAEIDLVACPGTSAVDKAIVLNWTGGGTKGSATGIIHGSANADLSGAVRINYGDATAFTALQGGNCIQDSLTGLVWEGKTATGGLHDRDATFTWYSSDTATNGGATGVAAGGVCNGVSAGCDTEKFVAAVNAEALCGFTDWRLPTPQELSALVDNAATVAPTIYPALTQQAAALYWTASPKAEDINGAWAVDFSNGSMPAPNKNTAARVRLVRGH